MKFHFSKTFVFFIVAGLFCLSTTAYALGNSNAPFPWKLHQVDEFVDQQIHEKDIREGRVNLKGPEAEQGYSYYLKKAVTAEQKSKIKELEMDKSLGLGEWKREAMRIIGELKMDSPRVTRADAEEIIGKYKDETSIKDAFNLIAGAPDWEGGSGISRSIYFMDDERKEAIYVFSNGVYHVVNDQNGKQTMVPFERDGSLPKPGTTAQPGN